MMLSEEEFYQKWRKYFKRYHRNGAHYPNDYEGDQMLLIVTDDVPSQAINSILSGNKEEYKVPWSVVWLADDDYEHLPDFQGAIAVRGTEPTVDAAWKSPFLGKSLADIVRWVRGIPKPPKAICRSYFAVLQKDLYDQRGMVLVCKIVEGQPEPETLPWTATRLSKWLVAYRRESWDIDFQNQTWG